MKRHAAGQGAEVLFSTFQFLDGATAGRVALNETLRTFFEDGDFDWVDQDALIPDGDRRLMIDDCHFTGAGRALVARNFFDAIVERGWLER